MDELRILSMQPFEAFWHERLGAVVVFKVVTAPPLRDYSYYRLPCAEESARAAVLGFLTGFGSDTAAMSAED